MIKDNHLLRSKQHEDVSNCAFGGIDAERSGWMFSFQLHIYRFHSILWIRVAEASKWSQSERIQKYCSIQVEMRYLNDIYNLSFMDHSFDFVETKRCIVSTKSKEWSMKVSSTLLIISQMWFASCTYIGRNCRAKLSFYHAPFSRPSKAEQRHPTPHHWH